MKKFIDCLRRCFPTKTKLVIRFVDMESEGSTSYSVKQITICINKKRSKQVRREILVHEYAHALEYDRHGEHSIYWGKLYAKVFHAMFEERKDACLS